MQHLQCGEFHFFHTQSDPLKVYWSIVLAATVWLIIWILKTNTLKKWIFLKKNFILILLNKTIRSEKNWAPYIYDQWAIVGNRMLYLCNSRRSCLVQHKCFSFNSHNNIKIYKVYSIFITYQQEYVCLS